MSTFHHFDVFFIISIVFPTINIMIEIVNIVSVIAFNITFIITVPIKVVIKMFMVLLKWSNALLALHWSTHQCNKDISAINNVLSSVIRTSASEEYVYMGSICLPFFQAKVFILFLTRRMWKIIWKYQRIMTKMNKNDKPIRRHRQLHLLCFIYVVCMLGCVALTSKYWAWIL